MKAFVVGPRTEISNDLHSLINCISERAAEVRWRGMLATDVITAKGVIKTMIKNSLGILGARANAECLEDRLGIMLGDGKAAFGRSRSADAANREAYEEYSRHYCSGDGGHAGGRCAPKRRCGGVSPPSPSPPL